MDEPIQTEEKAIAIIIATYNEKKYSLVTKAEAFSFLHESYGSTKEVNRITGIDETSIKRYMRISSLPDEVKELISSRKITSYHLAAELTRIKNEDRMIATAKNIIGLPREIGREVIRYILKNEKKEVEECVNTILELYKDEINVHVFIYNKNDFLSEKISQNNSMIKEIGKKISQKYSLKGQIITVNRDNEIFVVLDDEQIKIFKRIIKNNKNIKNIIKEVILNVIRSP